MTTARITLAPILLACLALAGCLNVQRPLADSDANLDGGMVAEGQGQPGQGSSQAGAQGPALPGPDGGTVGGAQADWPGMGMGGAISPPSVAGGGGDPGMWFPDGMAGGAMGGAGGMEWPDGMGWSVAGAGGAGGGPSSACCDDGDPCTLDYCNPDGTCQYESIATMTDRDGDMVSDGCDCDDLNADIHPGQSEFFVEPAMSDAAGPLGFDYDCDGTYTHLLTSEARTCEVYQGLDVCFGDGWLLSPGEVVPGCGGGGAYQACEFRDGMCTATVLMMLQRCR